MKKRALLLLAACAVLFSAQNVFAVTCDDWMGDWTVNYTADCDNVTLTAVCNNEGGSNPACLPVDKEGKPATYFVCTAHGKRASDNQTIQIRMISFDKNNYYYYEATDDEILKTGQDTPNAKIPKDAFTGTAFTVSGTNTYNLSSGAKGKGLTCEIDNSTCTLQKVIPAKVSKLLAFVQPIMPFIVIGSGDPAFVKGDKVTFDSDAIKPLIPLRIGSKIIIAISFVNPFALTAGDVVVSVNKCVKTITVK